MAFEIIKLTYLLAYLLNFYTVVSSLQKHSVYKK